MYVQNSDQAVSARLEMSPQKKPLAKAHLLFYKGLKAVGGNESKINVVYRTIQISFFVCGAMAAKFTPEGERNYLQEKAGISNLMLLRQSVQSLVKLLFAAIFKSG